MKTNITYDDASQETNDRKALIDMLFWYQGFDKFKLLVRSIKAGCPFDQLAFMCGFSGVEGYPVNAMWRRYHDKP